jgi:hypothetical protein
MTMISDSDAAHFDAATVRQHRQYQALLGATVLHAIVTRASGLGKTVSCSDDRDL